MIVYVHVNSTVESHTTNLLTSVSRPALHVYAFGAGVVAVSNAPGEGGREGGGTGEVGGGERKEGRKEERKGP